MTNLRYRGFNVNHFVDVVRRKGDLQLTTEIEKLKFLTFSSPALRFIYYQLHTSVLPPSTEETPQKLFLTEDVPLSAQFWEICINFTYLSDQERISLVARFNDPDDSLLVLIIMHSVSSQGVNLDMCCNRVIVITNASNAPLEWQSWGHVIRVFDLLVGYILV